MLLPRVALKTTNPKIGELAKSIGGTELWNEDEHIGLLVYNVTEPVGACVSGAYKGIYAWSGKQWQAISNRKGVTIDSETLVSTDKYSGANSYIIKSGGASLEILIERAFKIWTDHAGNDANNGKVLSLGDVNGLSGMLTANVVWEELGTLDATQPVSISGTGESAKLIVKSGSTSGNALVNVMIGDKVLWQWHIWVLTDDPTKLMEWL